MDNDRLEVALKQFDRILVGLNEKERCEFYARIVQKCQRSEGSAKKANRARKQLAKIAARLRELTPLEYCLDTMGRTARSIDGEEERKQNGTVWPNTGSFADCESHNTFHVDAFLFDDDDLDQLCLDGLIPSRHFCLNCRSASQVVPTNQITHSLSIDELHHLFSILLPSLGIDLANKIIVDIGSRLGAVLYAAALYCPQLSRVVGIERAAVPFDSLQRQILAEFSLGSSSPPIELLCADFRDVTETLAKADIVVMHNVFTFFAVDEVEQISCWRCLRDHLGPGTLLFHSPSLPSVTSHLELGFSTEEWLETLYAAAEDDSDDINSSSSSDTIFVYRVRSL